MINRHNLLAMTLLILAGCSNNSDTLTTDTNSATGVFNEPEALQAQFSGATFTSIEVLDGVTDVSAGNGVISFAANTVTWSYSNTVETGSYSETNDSSGTAELDGRQIAFNSNGENLVWDSKNYYRAATAQFDSQSSLVAYLDGKKYQTIEEVLVGERPDGAMAFGHARIQFDDDEALIEVTDILYEAPYTYVNGSSFLVSSVNFNATITILDDDRLVYNSTLYEQYFTTQFVSEETLLSFLDGTSYRSVEQLSIGESGTGITTLGHWFVDFTQNTFTWSYQDVSEVGTVEFTQDDSFDITLSERRYSVAVEGNDIILDGVRYTKNNGQ